MKIEKKISVFKIKMQKQTEVNIEKVHAICEQLDYKNSSRFSYIIDKLMSLNEFVQEFEIIKQEI